MLCFRVMESTEKIDQASDNGAYNDEAEIVRPTTDPEHSPAQGAAAQTEAPAAEPPRARRP